MLDYGWGNPGSIMLTDEETGHISEQNHPEYRYYNNNPTSDHNQNYSHQTTTPNFNFINTEPEPHFTPIPFHHHQQNPTNFTNFYHNSGSTGLEHSGPTGFLHLPKSEPLVVGGLDFNTELMINSRLGLNLGGRTYFASSSEDDFVNRLYRRSRILEPGLMNNYPRCQAEGCNADLTGAKHYHRRHKVCEFHSKAATAVVAGLTQRFCQQCSRFHLLSEFDNGKRSCRRRLADHNRRRRKCNQENSNKPQVESSAPNSSSENLTRSPHDSSSVTVAISPPRISLDCLGYGSH